LRVAYSGACRILASTTTFRLRNCPLTLYDDISGLDGDLDPLGDVKQFLGVAVPLSASVHAILNLCDAGRRMRRFGGWSEVSSIFVVRLCDMRSQAWADVHVLHLEVGCGLAVSIEDALSWCWNSVSRLWAAMGGLLAEPWRAKLKHRKSAHTTQHPTIHITLHNISLSCSWRLPLSHISLAVSHILAYGEQSQRCCMARTRMREALLRNAQRRAGGYGYDLQS
jgi:hypothetical protein